MVNVRELLKASQLPRLETHMLLQHVLQVSRVWLITHDVDPLDPSSVAQYRALEQQRLDGRPMAYLLGWREFMGHEFAVSPAVLIPRPETELLVETGLDVLARSGLAEPRVLDMGTGSGAIAVSIALACVKAQVVATDVSAEAVALARDNARRLGARVEFFHGNWYHAVSGQPKFDLIVSNPPYISANDPHLEQGDLRFEPAGALTDGADGLDALRAIARDAHLWLKPSGALWMEHGWDQASAVRCLLQQAGFKMVESLPDLAGIERVSGGYL